MGRLDWLACKYAILTLRTPITKRWLILCGSTSHVGITGCNVLYLFIGIFRALPGTEKWGADMFDVLTRRARFRGFCLENRLRLIWGTH